VIGVLFPSPSHQHVNVEQVFHGKSASISRTVSVVSGRAPAGDEKIFAPVCSQRTRRTGSDGLPLPKARPRTYSDRVIFLLRASDFIRRASSRVTLNVNVGMVLPYYRLLVDQVNLFLKEPRFPEAVIPSFRRVRPASAYDNMIQQRDIHSGCRLSELPGELYARSAWRGVT